MLKTTTESHQDGSTCLDRTAYPQEWNCEILNGEPNRVPVPNTKHQHVLSKLTAILSRELEDKGIILGAPCNVMVSPWDIVRPDILFIRKDRAGIIGEQIVLGSPDIVIEILSEDTRRRDLHEKRKIYANSGIPEYWIVDPDAESVEIQIWSELGYISMGIEGKGSYLSSMALTDLKLPVSNIFRS